MNENELEDIDGKKTRKLLTMCKSLHPRVDSVERLYWKGKNAGKWLISVQKSVSKEKTSLVFHLKKEEKTELVIEGMI